MTNEEALKAWVKRICDTCYADSDVIRLTLEEGSITPSSVFDLSKSADMLRCAIKVVRGFVETSRSENGMSISINLQAVNDNIIYFCKEYGLDASEFVSVNVIDDGSHLW